MDKFNWSGEGYRASDAPEPVDICDATTIHVKPQGPRRAKATHRRGPYEPTIHKIYDVIAAAHGDVSAAEIMEATDLSHATVYTSVNAMVASGKITRSFAESGKLRLYRVKA